MGHKQCKISNPNTRGKQHKSQLASTYLQSFGVMG
jgi:hypothetical protein